MKRNASIVSPNALWFASKDSFVMTVFLRNDINNFFFLFLFTLLRSIFTCSAFIAKSHKNSNAESLNCRTLAAKSGLKFALEANNVRKIISEIH
ncbi:hypothetical protein T01_3661 [Trichinella spiralis]|uniref:Uncharacterized protein n=1 Tax=Trichinella spiralis TaxID=6334 RepID=A0A0V1AV46_TRISP|nr:hypothetical protein T01_3661 [Trichinella spiralis]